MVKLIDDYGELRCPECNTIICCNDCGDMPDMCPGCNEVIDYEERMRPCTARIFFKDGSYLSVDCDDFVVYREGCYVAIRDELRIMTIPFDSVKYTTLIQNH